MDAPSENSDFDNQFRNFKIEADQRMTKLRTDIYKTYDIANRFIAFQSIPSSAVVLIMELLYDQYLRIVALDRIPFVDMPPELLDIEARSFSTLLNDLRHQLNISEIELSKNSVNSELRNQEPMQ